MLTRAIPVLATLGLLAAHLSAREPVDLPVRIVSHGASGVVVETAPGRTLILSAGHAFTGPGMATPIALDIAQASGEPRARGSGRKRVLAVDERADLALILLESGPFDGARVSLGGQPAAGANCLSLGYDLMRWPAVARPARVVAADALRVYTDTRPVQGRSGGPLLDQATGRLVGLCCGYENNGERRGVYSSARAIARFLESVRGVPGPRGVPAVREERSYGPIGSGTAGRAWPLYER